jgi:hypothetical protein
MLIPTWAGHSLENNNASCVAAGGFDFVEATAGKIFLLVY